MSADSKPVPPSTPPPSPPPGGPTHPTPTGPASPGRVTSVLDETARNLRAAVARLQTPARRDVPKDVAPTGGPVPNLPAVSGDGEGAGVRRAIPEAGAGSETGPSIGRLYSA